jgi:hypothetical protein
MIDDCVYYDEYLGPIAHLQHMDAWNALETFFGRELSFHVSITRNYESGNQGTQSKAVERLLKKRKAATWNLGPTRSGGNRPV